ncbi:hypothetical protein Sjap_005219 [Stephania japonica]|uniref:Uncharacterized protein n=1 Tax=Stephania japonica TaxID=461633 RepID=A0AAP0PLM6_9MAGN
MGNGPGDAYTSGDPNVPEYGLGLGDGVVERFGHGVTMAEPRSKAGRVISLLLRVDPSTSKGKEVVGDYI